MNREEFAMFAAALRTYYPKESILPNSQAMSLWYERLKDIPYKVAETALNEWVDTNKWPPTIADIREKSSTIVNGEIEDWGAAWEETIRAIRKYGVYNMEDALNSLSPMARKITQQIGYKHLCLSEDMTQDRANFRMMYEQAAKREKLSSQTSQDVKRLISEIQAKRISLNNENGLQGVPKLQGDKV